MFKYLVYAVNGPKETSLLKNIYLIDFSILQNNIWYFLCDRKSIKLYFKMKREKKKKQQTFPPKQKSKLTKIQPIKKKSV